MSSFASMMRTALAEREAAEHELADAVAESALGGGESSHALESARAAHQKASDSVAKLIEEASRYAAEHRALSEELERERSALAASRESLRVAEAKLATSGSSVEAFGREAEAAKKEATEAEERCREALEREKAAVLAAREAKDGRTAAEESRDAAVAAANASVAMARSARAECDEELRASRLSVSQAQAVVLDTRRTTELELGEARRDADLHRQRRLAARTELLTVAKALEAARGDARSSEQAARDLLVPRLLEHSKILGGLVERVVAVGSTLGGSVSDMPQPQQNALGDGAAQMPAKYLGELAEEIQRIDSGLHLLSQTLDVVEGAVESNNRRSSCFGIFRSCCADSQQQVQKRLPKVVVNSKKSKGYRRVDDTDDDTDDDSVL